VTDWGSISRCQTVRQAAGTYSASNTWSYRRVVKSNKSFISSCKIQDSHSVYWDGYRTFMEQKDSLSYSQNLATGFYSTMTPQTTPFSSHPSSLLTHHYHTFTSKFLHLRPKYTRVGTLIVATIYIQLIQNRYMFRSFTVLQCSHQHCVQPVASDVEVVGYL